MTLKLSKWLCLPALLSSYLLLAEDKKAPVEDPETKKGSPAQTEAADPANPD